MRRDRRLGNQEELGGFPGRRRPAFETAVGLAGGPQPGSSRDDLLAFVLEQSHERIVVVDDSPAVVYRNERARRFLDRHALPADLLSLARKLLAAVALGTAAESFPGQICVRRQIGGRDWVFRVAFREGDQPRIVIYFSDATVSDRFDLNALRGQHRLTRRESDVLRHLLDGLRNLEIAEELAISEQTVKDHLSSVYRKFGVPDRFALLRCLIGASRK